MLGFNENRQIVAEPFIGEMHDAMLRAQSGELTQKERDCEERLMQARKKYNFIWQ